MGINVKQNKLILGNIKNSRLFIILTLVTYSYRNFKNTDPQVWSQYVMRLKDLGWPTDLGWEWWKSADPNEQEGACFSKLHKAGQLPWTSLSQTHSLTRFWEYVFSYMIGRKLSKQEKVGLIFSSYSCSDTTLQGWWTHISWHCTYLDRLHEHDLICQNPFRIYQFFFFFKKTKVYLS